jgi:hypothetical protein
LTNWLLPPNIFHLRLGDRDAKYNVISERDLIHATSENARDVYHLGRFSKRIALVWSRDKAAADTVLRAHASAMRSVAQKVYFSMAEKFTLLEFIHHALELSYIGEFRVEAPDKVDRLYRAEKDYYDRAFAQILEEMSQAPWNIVVVNSTYQRPIRFFFDMSGGRKLKRFIRKSRIRAKLRWPKSIFTVPNWIDYLLAKIERTHGIKIELTEKERKFVFIYGWKYFFLLKRKKALK